MELKDEFSKFISELNNRNPKSEVLNIEKVKDNVIRIGERYSYNFMIIEDDLVLYFENGGAFITIDEYIDQ